MLDLWTRPFRRNSILPLLLVTFGLGLPAAAPAQGLNVRDSSITAEPAAEGAAEDVTAGATIVRGRYNSAGSETEWEAAIRNGQPERIVEWRSYAEGGNANMIFSYYNGALMHYAEKSQRRNAGAGPAASLVNVELELSFQQGRYSHGSKIVDNKVMEPNDTDIRTATEQAAAAMQRVSATRSAWGERRQSGDTGFSMLQIPSSEPPAETRRLAGEGTQVVFRCQDDSLFAILGSADTLVVAPPGREPIVLSRQPRGARYDYLGNGWAASRRGDELRLEEASGRAFQCRHGN